MYFQNLEVLCFILRNTVFSWKYMHDHITLYFLLKIPLGEKLALLRS